MLVSLFKSDSKNEHIQPAQPTVRYTEIKPFDTLSRIPAKSLQKAQERLRFLCQVVNYARDLCITEESAAHTVSTMYSAYYPVLSASGKGGTSALSYYSFKNWIKLTGRTSNGLPDERKLSALVDNHQRKEYVKPGDEMWWQTFMRIFLNGEQMPIEKAYRFACDIFRSYDGFNMPSMVQVRYYIDNKFPIAAQMMARKGESWATDRLLPIINRDWSAIAPGEVWIGDHHKLDCYVRVWDDEKNFWRVTRPWLTAWMDARSLYFVGVEISADAPNTVSILRALAYGCLNSDMHMPAVLYSDNGADFKRQGFATPLDVDGVEHSIVKKLGITTLFAKPYSGRSKPIERVFKEVAEGYCKTLPSYLGSNPGERPAEASGYEKHPEAAPDLDEVQEGLKNYIYNVYHRKAQKAGKILGVDSNGEPLTPCRAFRARKTYGQTWSGIGLKEAMLMPLRGSRKVGQGYTVRILGNDYRASQFGQELNTHYAKQILIKQDMFFGGYFAYTLDGFFICALEAPPAIKAIGASSDEVEAAKLSAECAHAARQKKWTKAVIRDATGLTELVSPDDALKMLEPGARLVKIGEKRSVKGSTHLYRINKVLLPCETIESVIAPAADVIQATITQSPRIPLAIPTQDVDATPIPPPNRELIDKLNAIKNQRRNDY